LGSHYRLNCVHCGKSFEDEGDCFLLGCDAQHTPSLLRASYSDKAFTVEKDEPGLFRYRRWLPVRRAWPSAGAPVVLQSSKLSECLKLDSLHLAFSGYWPERGAHLETCSFKELEALPVCARLPGGPGRTLVVSSAGNTGRAFLQIGSRYGVSVLVVVPESAAADMWITGERHASARLAVLKGGGDYLDAINIANRIAALPGFYPEGGARNVARRDGLGTVLLSAVEALGQIPHHYFQAVGSGTGGIAAWEMNLRLIEDGRFGGRRMRLHVVQNSPFSVMSEAWGRGSRELAPVGEREAKRRIGRLYSAVLSNRNPPYGIAGGVYDALTDTQGHAYSVSRREAQAAGRLFETLEGCDLDPAAEVALAGLLQAVAQGRVGRKEIVLLNLTGGGREKLAREGRLRPVPPDIELARPDMSDGELEEQIHERHLR